MGHIKNVKVHNPKNVVVQIPGFITSVKWALQKDDEVEVLIGEDGESVILRPKKAQIRRYLNGKSKRMAGISTGFSIPKNIGQIQ